MFDLSRVSIIATIGGVPTDISAGLVIDEEFMKMARENEEDVKSRKGTRGTEYVVNSEEDNTRMIDLTYLPNALAVPILQTARKNKSEIKLSITNESSPKFAFVSSKAHVASESEIGIHGKDGFKNMVFKIRCNDGDPVFGV